MGTMILIAALDAAVTGGEVENFPLVYQIACILLTGLFLWTFSIARDPRGWRRLYQSKFSRSEDISVNRNKWIDETIKRYGIAVAMIFLTLDVAIFVFGITYQHRHSLHEMSKEERFRAKEMDKYR